MPSGVYKEIGGGVHHLGTRLGPDMNEAVSPGWGFLVETLLTTVLVFTVLMAAVNTRTKSPIAPLAIGFAVVVDILAG